MTERESLKGTHNQKACLLPDNQYWLGKQVPYLKLLNKCPPLFIVGAISVIMPCHWRYSPYQFPWRLLLKAAPAPKNTIHPNAAIGIIVSMLRLAVVNFVMVSFITLQAGMVWCCTYDLINNTASIGRIIIMQVRSLYNYKPPRY